MERSKGVWGLSTGSSRGHRRPVAEHSVPEWHRHHTSRTPGSRGHCGADGEMRIPRSCAHSQLRAPGKRPGAQRTKTASPDPHRQHNPHLPLPSPPTPGAESAGRDAEPLVLSLPLPCWRLAKCPLQTYPTGRLPGPRGEKGQRVPLWLQGAGPALLALPTAGRGRPLPQGSVHPDG